MLFRSYFGGEGERTVATHEGAAFSGEVAAGEGTYTASVYAVDAACNTGAVSTTSWRYDATAPSKPVIAGAPASPTNVPGFSMTASAIDNYTETEDLVFHWTFGETRSTGASFSGTAAEGGNTVSVYAKDSAGNRSETATYTWTLDTVKPTVELATVTPADFKASGAPMVVTATFGEPVTGFAAASVEVTNGTVANVSGSGAEYAFDVTPTEDGDVSVSILADAVVDAAGNGNSASATLTRRYDTTAPTAPVITGDPADGTATNAVAFAFAATAQDATELTYYWSLSYSGGEGATQVATYEGAEFSGEVESGEGTYTASVYAVDAACNTGAVAATSWRHDATAPSKPVIANAPDSSTNVPGFSMSASATDNFTGTEDLVFHWTFGETRSTGASFSGTAAEDGNTVSVYAKEIGRAHV